MRRHAVLYALVVGAMPIVFVFAQARDVSLFTDVVPPVASSVVMLAHGALCGIAIGTALSTAGSLGAPDPGDRRARCVPSAAVYAFSGAAVFVAVAVPAVAVGPTRAGPGGSRP